ncbi:MAG TPA: aspartate 1-decarboxylase [Vicinamibacterales bacterium]|nr:aspartate 1-decarboxylase [Vicinamibacterales bacterium]
MKLRTICKSKIHHAVVTGAELHYAGSIGIDAALMRRVDIVPGEQVAVWNVNNGSRIETYAIELPEGSGQVVVNGAAARHFQPGDRVIIVAFCLTDEPIQPKMIAVDERNAFVRELHDGARAERRETAPVGV